MLGYDLATKQGVGMGYYRNDVAYGGTLTSNATGTEFSAAYNSWDIAGLAPAAADFASLDTTGIMGPRNADGSVPNLEFLRLSAGSKLRSAGIDVGLPYTDKAPDLGAFQYGATATMPLRAAPQSAPSGVDIRQTGTSLVVKMPAYQAGGREAGAFSLFTVQGSRVGQWSFTGSELSVNIKSLPRGIYLGRINDGMTEFGRKVLIR